MNDLPNPPPSFEDSLGALEVAVRDLESGRLGLDDALARYEEGVRLIRHCHDQLQQAEQRILQLTGIAGEGGDAPILQPFQHEATAQQADKSPPRRPRKSPGAY